MTELCDRINLRLKALKLSARKASLAGGLHHDSLGKVLKKPEQSPTLETIRKLSIGLQTTPEWLAFGLGENQTIAAPELLSREPDTSISLEGEPRPQSSDPSHGTSYIQVSPELLRQIVIAALQNESIPAKQAVEYADGVLESIRGRAIAHVVLRIEGSARIGSGSPAIAPADQS